MRDVIGRMRWGMMGGGYAGRGYAGRCWKDEGYSERMICGTEICGTGICGTDHLPEIGPAGLPFLDQPPPIHEERETRTANDLQAEKKNAYFVFNLLIINHINQYFNIRLHLIRFITYNLRIFIAKYLFEDKTCSIFAYVKITLTNRRTRG